MTGVTRRGSAGEGGGTVRLMTDSFSAAVARLRDLGEDAELVSGIHSNDSLSWRHVWVELAGNAHDFAEGRSLIVPTGIFNMAMRVQDRVAMPGAEVLRVLGELDSQTRTAARRSLLQLMRRLHLAPPASLRFMALWHR